MEIMGCSNLGTEQSTSIFLNESSPDLSRFGPLNIFVITSDVAVLKGQRGPRIVPLNPSASLLIDTLERQHGLALVFIEGASNDTSVLDINSWRGNVVLPRQCMLHPVLVVTLWANHVRST